MEKREAQAPNLSCVIHIINKIAPIILKSCCFASFIFGLWNFGNVTKTEIKHNLIIFKKAFLGSSHGGSVETNLTSIHEDSGSIPGLAQWVKDLELLWLWRRLATAAQIRPLAWELPYAMGVVLKRQKKKKKKKKKKKEEERGRRRRTCDLLAIVKFLHFSGDPVFVLC